MSSSIWKVPFSENFFLSCGMNSSLFWYTSQVWSSSLLVFRWFLGKRISLYNGKKFFPVLVKSSMVGSKFGEFRVTKVISGNLKMHGSKKKKGKQSKRSS